MTDKLDWTAPLMLDDDKGTEVTFDSVQGIISDYGHAWFNMDGTHQLGTLPRIINRPKPVAEPVGWGEALTGPEVKAPVRPPRNAYGTATCVHGTPGGQPCKHCEKEWFSHPAPQDAGEPIAKPVEWGEALTGPEVKALGLPGDTPVKHDGFTYPAHRCTWKSAIAYQLPANNPAYIVHAWNKAHPDEQPFRVWMGGDEAPADWDRSGVLLREGRVMDRVSPDYLWDHFRDGDASDIIGYRIAQPVEQLPADEPDTVTVPRMTEAEIAALTNKVLPNKAWTPEIANAHYKGASEVLRALGATRKPTPLDRFTASHPNWRDLPVEEAVRLALEQRGEG